MNDGLIPSNDVGDGSLGVNLRSRENMFTSSPSLMNFHRRQQRPFHDDVMVCDPVIFLLVYLNCCTNQMSVCMTCFATMAKIAANMT